MARLSCWVVVGAAALWLATPGAIGQMDGPLRQVPLIELEVRPLSGDASTEPETLVLTSDRPGQLDFPVQWDGIGRVRVELDARAEPRGDAGVHSLSLRARLTLPGGRRVEASRTSLVDQRATLLFELYRESDRPFTLAISATVSETWEVTRRPSVGARVRFDIEVVRVIGNTRVSLERNMLHTFERQAVRYEFESGPQLKHESLTLSLTPVRLIDDLVEIRVRISGRLPHGDDVTVIGREETLVANRGSSSAINVIVGDPPSGYVFQVTPRF